MGRRGCSWCSDGFGRCRRATSRETLADARRQFEHRHRDLTSVLERNFRFVAERLGHLELLAEHLSADHRQLIGAYFTHEYSIEAAALEQPFDRRRPGSVRSRPGRDPLRHEFAGHRRRAPVLDRVPVRRRRRGCHGATRPDQSFRDDRRSRAGRPGRVGSLGGVGLSDVISPVDRHLRTRPVPERPHGEPRDGGCPIRSLRRRRRRSDVLRDVHGVRRSSDPAAVARDDRLHGVPSHDAQRSGRPQQGHGDLPPPDRRQLRGAGPPRQREQLRA